MKNKKTILIVAIVAFIAIVGFVMWRKKKGTQTETAFSPSSATPQDVIPAKVFAEPVEDWLGDVLTYEGVKYTPVNGVWTVVK